MYIKQFVLSYKLRLIMMDSIEKNGSNLVLNNQKIVIPHPFSFTDKLEETYDGHPNFFVYGENNDDTLKNIIKSIPETFLPILKQKNLIGCYYRGSDKFTNLDNIHEKCRVFLMEWSEPYFSWYVLEKPNIKKKVNMLNKSVPKKTEKKLKNDELDSKSQKTKVFEDEDSIFKKKQNKIILWNQVLTLEEWLGLSFKDRLQLLENAKMLYWQEPILQTLY